MLRSTGGAGRSASLLNLLSLGDAEREGEMAGTFHQKILAKLETIAKVAIKSKNLKGTFIKILKTSAQIIAGDMASRTRNSETEILTKENHRLQTEVSGLQREVAELR